MGCCSLLAVSSLACVPSWALSLWGCPYPSSSTGCIPLGLSLPHCEFLYGPQSLRDITAPVCVTHGSENILWHRAPPSKCAFLSCLQQYPLPHASSISFPQTAIFTFFLRCPLSVSSCVFSSMSSVSLFVWSYVRPAPVYTTLS